MPAAPLGRVDAAVDVTDMAVDDAVDLAALNAWADEHLAGSGSCDIAPLGEGHSNLTFSLSRSGAPPYVLRRPPHGPLLPTAHDVLREFRILSLLQGGVQGGAARVPRVVAACADPAVVGAPFYVMDRVVGEVIREDLPLWLSPPRRQALGRDLIHQLASVHQVPVTPFVDAGFGRPSGYLERQLSRWVGQREGLCAAVEAAGGNPRSLPDYDRVRDWLSENQPLPVPPTLVHGDFKLDNVIVDPVDASVAAIVDWEMATVGDPRADLGYLLTFWPAPDEDVPLSMSPTTAGGFPTRAELVSRWEESMHRPAGDLRWFRALALWKLAILLEVSYHRWLAGQSDDAFFARLERGVPDLLAAAREVARA